ncbi:hypothetical protein [Parendozoicomonas sp. Alg238-R29]|uniref:hypothetical protein n=1 Tax=Parendozoicomonas sp. Alg238-R29 TaxID=2993446 RepID=UPI00248EEC30|nr:hypothetical protein [Parendozoicomonas sp. Alg238-R29]
MKKHALLIGLVLSAASSIASALECKVYVKHVNFYEEIGKVEGRKTTDYSNHWGKIYKKLGPDYYEEIGKYASKDTTPYSNHWGKIYQKLGPKYYEDFAKVEDHRFKIKHVNFYEEVGKYENAKTTDYSNKWGKLYKKLGPDSYEKYKEIGKVTDECRDDQYTLGGAAYLLGIITPQEH